MKRITIVLLLIIGIFSVSLMTANADVIKVNKRFDDEKTRINYLEDKGDYANCDGIFTQEGLELIREVLNWIRIIAPILLILFIALDLGSAVMSSDNDAISKAVKRIAPRMIGTVLLFFVPTIIRAVLNIEGVRGAITIPDDPLCHAMVAKETQENYYELI